VAVGAQGVHGAARRGEAQPSPLRVAVDGHPMPLPLRCRAHAGAEAGRQRRGPGRPVELAKQPLQR
jgi:hypothetical protein